MKKSLICAMAIFFSLSLRAEGEVVENFANINQPSATSAYTPTISSFDNHLPLIYRNARCGTSDTIGTTQGIWLCRVVGTAKKYNSYVELGQDENTTEGRKEIKFEGGVKGISFAYRQFGYDPNKGDDNARFILALKINGTAVDSVQFDPTPTYVSGVFTKTLDVKVPAKITIANLSYPKDNPSTHTYGRMVVGPITITPYLQFSVKDVRTTVGCQYRNTHLIDNRDNQKPIQYKSSNTKVATVDDDGTVTTFAEGSATITATWDGLSTSYTLTVTKAGAKAVHRLGTYNIRTSGASSDTGNKAWSARRDALVSMIRDTMDYDAITLDEVASDQLSYLKQKLGNTYTFLTSGRAGNSVLAYRTAKYDVLDNGCFWLSKDGKEGKSWDDNNYRAFVWAKLQDKMTDEIFFYGSTHLGLTATAMRNGSQMAVDYFLKIVGEDYPCFISGDMNFEPVDYVPHANFKERFGDAREMSKTTPRGSYFTFSSGMVPTAADKLLDYLFVRNAEIESYYVSNGTGAVGRTLLPSDHMPLMCEVTMLSPNRSHTHRVTNMDELRQAAALVQAEDTILLDGSFDLGTTSLMLTTSCTVLGTEKSDITAQTQLFTTGQKTSINLENLHVHDVTIHNEAIKGGIINANGHFLNVKNCSFLNNTTEGMGWISNERAVMNIDHCSFIGNKALYEMGCIYMSEEVDLTSCRNDITVTNCLFENNEAFTGSAIYVGANGGVYIYGCSFIRNIGDNQGAVVISSTSNQQEICIVNNSFIQNRIHGFSSFQNISMGGSAIYLQTASNKGKTTLVNNTIVGNHTVCINEDGTCGEDFYGGAVYSVSGCLAAYNNIIAGNYSSCPARGDISIMDPDYAIDSQWNIYSCESNMNFPASLSDILADDYPTACTELASLFGGQPTQEEFIPNLCSFGPAQDILGCAPIRQTYAGQSILILDKDARSAAQIQADILHRGNYTGILTVDQTGADRLDLSAPGSIEYGTHGEPYVGLETVSSFYQSNIPSIKKVLIDGRIVISINGILRNIF